MLSTEPVRHIRLDPAGAAWIDDTRIKVIEVALDHVAYGWSAEEVQRQHPHLSRAQVHAALGYYYDHQETFDAEIARSLDRAEKTAATVIESPARLRLRALGHLR